MSIKTSKKKTSAPSTAGRRVVDLDAALGNSPIIRLGGREFDGREFTLAERTRWLNSEVEADVNEQIHLLAALLSARSSEPVTIEWLQETVTTSQVIGLVQHLFGRGDEGNA